MAAAAGSKCTGYSADVLQPGRPPGGDRVLLNDYFALATCRLLCGLFLGGPHGFLRRVFPFQ